MSEIIIVLSVINIKHLKILKNNTFLKCSLVLLKDQKMIDISIGLLQWFTIIFDEKPATQK